MRRISFLISTLAVTLAVVPVCAAAQQGEPSDSLEARVWVDRGDEPVVQRGDEVRVYYRTSADAYVAIFRIDTDGVVSLVYPQHPDMDEVVRGGRDYRLLFPNSARWNVDEDPGAGYFFMVASPEPLDLSLLGFDDETGWDLSQVGATVYEDPYVAIDDYVATIVPDWESVPYGLDFLTYNVGNTHEYPRFLCYDCHSYQSYARWNPYTYSCSTYRVVIWDDPYFYPRYRYVGTRVVFGRPFGPRPRYEVVSRRVTGVGWAPLVRAREAPERRVVEYKESPRAPAYQPRNPRPSGSAAPASARATPSRALPSRTAPPDRVGASGRVAAPRTTDPSAARAGRTAPPRATAVTPPSGSERPTLQRRPTTPSARLPARNDPTAGRATSRGATSRGAATRGTTSRGNTGPGAATRVPTRRPGGFTPSRPPTAGAARSSPSARPATGVRPPARAAPRGGASGGRPAPASAGPRARGGPPSAGASRPTSGRPSATSRRPSGGGAGARGRRPGGRGGAA
jgi:hypothetical protein